MYANLGEGRQREEKRRGSKIRIKRKENENGGSSKSAV
jgi:hypothetical protein